MTNPQIVSEEPINVSQLKEYLKIIKKRDKELNFRAAKTEEYLQIFPHLEAKQAGELYDELMKLNVPRLKDSHVHKIIDLLPKTDNDLKIILQSYTITVSNDNVKKIVAIVGKYIPEQKAK
jgi:DNA-directed RNA polymerase subunit F